MTVCPICLFVNAAAATACTRCGRFRFDQKPAGVSTMTADDPAGELPPLSDPCAATTPDARAQVGQETRRSSRLALAASLREPVPAPTMMVAVSPSDAMTSPRPGVLAGASDIRTPAPRPTLRFGLEVVRGEKLGKFLPILDGRNVVGRAVNEPVDIDLTGQEPVERVWVSRKHAVIHLDARGLILEDLNSLNGTFVNRVKLSAGTHRALSVGDVVQFGTVQVRVVEPPQ